MISYEVALFDFAKFCFKVGTSKKPQAQLSSVQLRSKQAHYTFFVLIVLNK